MEEYLRRGVDEWMEEYLGRVDEELANVRSVN